MKTKNSDRQFNHLYREVPEIMEKIYEILPFGQEINLSNGRVGKLKKFIEPKIKANGNYEGRYCFAFDIVFDKGSPDHLEFYTIHTGGGGTPLIGVTVEGE